MEGVPQVAVCEEHPKAQGGGQREAQGKERVCASSPPCQAARICPGSGSMLGAEPRTPGFQVRLFPTPPWLSGAEQPSPSGLLHLAGRQLPALSLLLWAHVSFSTQRPGCKEMACSAPAVPVLAAQAMCTQKCIYVNAAACASTD